MLFLKAKVYAAVTKIRILRIFCFPVTPIQMCKLYAISHSSNIYKISALAAVGGGFSKIGTARATPQRRGKP